MSDSGELVLVATPIGNVADLSPRAIETLSSADVICCEDTRHSGLLFARMGIERHRLISVHGHNEAERAREVVSLLSEGKRVALVTDAGMPAISDPGARIVAAAHEAGARVSVVPGASAAVSAVAVAGFSEPRWRFEGFVPRRPAERRARLAEIASSPVASVVYEAPKRVQQLISDLAELCGPDRQVVVCRELTKLHEEVWRGTLGEARDHWPASEARGEFAVVLDGLPTVAAQEPPADEALSELVEELVASGVTRRDAISQVAARLGVARRVVYAAGVRPPGGGGQGGL